MIGRVLLAIFAAVDGAGNLIARAVGRFVGPRLVFAFALLGYGATRAGTWVRRKISRANDLP